MQAAPIPASDNRTVQLDGARLSGFRRARGLTREQMVEAAEGAHRLSVATIKRAERGAPVYLETARRLAGLLDVSVQSLVRDGTNDATSYASDRGPEATPVGVSVLPFRVIGYDPDARTLAEGIVEDLTTRLSNWWFPVICRASTLEYGEGVSDGGAAAQLQVGYTVQGSVQRFEAQVRVQARLVAAATGEQLWAAEYNRPFSAVFLLQDELTAGIVASVNRRMLSLEAPRLQQHDPDDLQAWELAVRGSQSFYGGTREAMLSARALLLEALRRDRNLALALYLLARTYQQEIINQWSPRPEQALRALAEVSAEFQRCHPGDARANVVEGYLLIYQGRREHAAERLQAALADAPNLHVAYSLFGQVLAMCNEPDRALEQFEIAARLSPRDSELWSIRTATALAHFVAERYAEASHWAEMAAALRPDLAFTFGTVASARALNGDLPGARQALQRMAALHPGLSAHAFDMILASTQPAIAARFLSGLKLAGLAT